MATYLDSSQGPFVSGSSLPNSLRFSASRLAFCLAIGIAVVGATGIMLARMDVPIGASSSHVKNSAIRPATSISLAANANPAPVTHSAVIAPVAASRPTRITLSTKAQSVKMPDAVKPAIFRLDGKEFLVARMVSIKTISVPVAEPAPANVTRASDSAPTAVNPVQPSLGGAAKPAPLNVESL